jgi:hypothetical protein
MRGNLFPTRATSTLLVLAIVLSGFAQAQSPASTQKPLDNQSTVPQQVSPGPLQPQPTTTPKQDAPLPNAPSSTAAPTTVVLGPDGKPLQSATQSQSGTAPQTPGATQPLGTAAAGTATTAGGAASRPAGTAIAPAKQRQVRSFLLKMGLIAAGGVALGTVYALSKGSPSKPPNSAAATPAP